MTYLRHQMIPTQSYQEQSFIISELLLQYSKKSPQIKNYYTKIHSCFYDLKKSYPLYFSRLVFDNNGPIPYSEDLDNIIQDFQVAGLINKLNPTFDTIIINPSSIDKYIKEYTKDHTNIPPEHSIQEIVSHAKL